MSLSLRVQSTSNKFLAWLCRRLDSEFDLGKRLHEPLHCQWSHRLLEVDAGLHNPSTRVIDKIGNAAQIPNEMQDLQNEPSQPFSDS